MPMPELHTAPALSRLCGIFCKGVLTLFEFYGFATKVSLRFEAIKGFIKHQNLFYLPLKVMKITPPRPIFLRIEFVTHCRYDDALFVKLVCKLQLPHYQNCQHDSDSLVRKVHNTETMQ